MEPMSTTVPMGRICRADVHMYPMIDQKDHYEVDDDVMISSIN